MNKPIDASRWDQVFCLVAPQMRTDQAGAPRADRDGVIQYAVRLAVSAADGGRQGSAVIDVVVSGEPDGVAAGVPVKVEGLWHSDWSFDGRSGETWRADAITPAKPSPAALSALPSAARSKGGEA